jgi:hypothetical protein
MLAGVSARQGLLLLLVPPVLAETAMLLQACGRGLSLPQLAGQLLQVASTRF